MLFDRINLIHLDYFMKIGTITDINVLENYHECSTNAVNWNKLKYEMMQRAFCWIGIYPVFLTNTPSDKLTYKCSTQSVDIKIILVFRLLNDPNLKKTVFSHIVLRSQIINVEMAF